MDTQFDILKGKLALKNGADLDEFADAIPPDEALFHIVTAAYSEMADALEDGPLSASLERILKGWTDVLHRTLEGLEKQADRAELEMKNCAAIQDYSEVMSVELERKTERLRNIESAMEAVALMRDAGASAYEARCASLWRPMHGSRPASKIITSAMIDARDLSRSRKILAAEGRMVSGVKIALFGDKNDTDYKRVADVLDKVFDKHSDMTLLLTGQKSGVDACAMSWAQTKGVDIVIFKLEGHASDRYFRRNERMLSETPKGVLIFSEKSAFTRHAMETAKKMGLPVKRCGLAA
ncbi:MAG: DUF2493 domain-containing protein [Henriciella sp.]|nr:DUF2493 domain-containing protein [Henriciella sp.]